MQDPVPAPAAAGAIAFPSHNPVVLRDMLDPGCRGAPIRACGYLTLPAGRTGVNRHPAIVLLEGLGGLKAAREFAYGRDLAAEGFVTLLVDSFASRDAIGLGETRRALVVTESMMLADAFGALAALRRHPAVDPGRIAVLGFSYGGMVSVLAAYDQMKRLFLGEVPGFAAHVSHYGCTVPRLDDPRTTGAPILVQLGARDRNVSLRRAARIADDLRAGGSPVERALWDAWHQWDGADVQRRFVRFSLEGLRMRVDRDHRIRLEGLGLPVRGPLSRRIAIALGVKLSGYHVQRDPAVEAATYRRLLDFLHRAMPAVRSRDASPSATG